MCILLLSEVREVYLVVLGSGKADGRNFLFLFLWE